MPSRIRQVSKTCKISNKNVEILSIHEDYGTTTFFTLMLLNGLLVLVAPVFDTDRRNVKRRTECFSEEFLHVCEEERWHVSLQKFNSEASESRQFIVSYAQQLSVFHNLPALLI